jgi:hypothetical protein
MANGIDSAQDGSRGASSREGDDGNWWNVENNDLHSVSHLVSLNFKVPLYFRHRLKLHAAMRGRTMTEVLHSAFALYFEAEDARRRPNGANDRAP